MPCPHCPNTVPLNPTSDPQPFQALLDSLPLPPHNVHNLLTNTAAFNDLKTINNLSLLLQEWSDAHTAGSSFANDPNLHSEELDFALNAIMAWNWEDSFPALDFFIRSSEENWVLVYVDIGAYEEKGG
jgi:hypothetical protein